MIVSCADILASVTRDLVVMVGGPYYDVALGRLDGKVSKSSLVEGTLPRPTWPMHRMIDLFRSRNFSVQEMVALSGAHTIGFSHCKEFKQGLTRNDSQYSHRFAEALRNACADYPNNPTLSVFNDIMTPNKFDNLYYQNLPKGLGLLQSDHALNVDSRTSPFVQMYAKDQDKFFSDFAKAMEKLSVYGVITSGRKGEIRRKCDAIN
ncbi:hypothetical protein ACFE04_009301 [Oxalis oulophora]